MIGGFCQYFTQYFASQSVLRYTKFEDVIIKLNEGDKRYVYIARIALCTRCVGWVY